MNERLKLIALVSLSLILSSTALIVVYEYYAEGVYEEWKSNFDNMGWFGKITVPSSNPILMWEYLPHAQNREITTNNYGFRGKDFNISKREGVDRYAFVGDSVTLGMKVSNEETFVYHFERLANSLENQSVLEAFNFGVDGYNVKQVSELTKTKVLAFSPDSVIYVMCLNDFDFTESSGDKIRFFQKPDSFFNERLELLYRQLFRIDFHIFHYRKNKDVLFQQVINLRNTLKAANIRFSVVIVPTFDARFESFSAQPTQLMHREIGIFLKENSIESLDLLSVFAKKNQPPSDFANDPWHPNKVGHGIIAEAIKQWLL